MKIKQIFQLVEDLKILNFNGKLAYAIAKNRRILDQEIESLKETIKHTEKYKEYDSKRIELAKKHAKKDENDVPVEKDGNFLLEDEVAFKKELEVLQTEYKEAIDDMEKKFDAFNTLLEEEFTTELYTITEDMIPETATANEVYTLLKIIK